MSGTNETRRIERHETCKCKCRFEHSVCHNKKRWNNDKCKCECKELIDKGVCDKRFIWNLSNCECECYKSCDFSEYLDYKNYKCKKMLLDKLVECSCAEECTENIEETRLIEKMKTSINAVLARCTLFYFQYFLQLTLELLAIFFVLTATEKKMLLVLKI